LIGLDGAPEGAAGSGVEGVATEGVEGNEATGPTTFSIGLSRVLSSAIC